MCVIYVSINQHKTHYKTHINYLIYCCNSFLLFDNHGLSYIIGHTVTTVHRELAGLKRLDTKRGNYFFQQAGFENIWLHDSLLWPVPQSAVPFESVPSWCPDHSPPRSFAPRTPGSFASEKNLFCPGFVIIRKKIYKKKKKIYIEYVIAPVW